MAVLEHQPAGERPPLTAVLHEWVTTVDHKKVGLLYVLMSLVFLFVAGAEALLMRWQLFTPRGRVLGPDQFNQLFTMHGTTMVFFVGMPILIGIANYLVPLMIGARDMAFPRLNALGFWLTLFGAVLVYLSFLTGAAPAIGWFAYAPLTERTFARGPGTDFWIVGLLVSGIGTTAGGVNFVATILGMRAPGMSLSKLPFYVWTMLWTSVQIVLVMPPLTAALVMLLFDRQLGSLFFDTQAGGSALLWQHLFWFFGHPEVYILILPAFGMISEVVPVFSRKVLFGYEFMAAATMAIAFLALGVWAHHMFTVGLSRTLDVYFAGASLLISIPTGIKIFNWLATMYGGKIRFATPMLFATGFLGMFVLGGLTGIMLATAPLDFQFSDSYFVVGHFHWVLIGGTLFGVFAGIYYWYPKVTGRMLSERLGRWHFWLLLVGFILTFGPMHVAGILGMPRRIYSYEPGRGWELWNQLATVGALIQAPSYLIFAWNVVSSLRGGRPAGADPWDAWTLEWATASPPPAYNFEKVPTVRSRRPLWDLKHPDDPDWKYEGTITEPKPAVPGAEPSPDELTARPLALDPTGVGMLCFLASEAAFFSTLIMGYLVFLGKSRVGPGPGEVLSLRLVLGTTACLLASSLTIHLAGRALARGRLGGFRLGLTATILLGIAFLAGTGYEWHELIYRHGLTISRNLFGTTFYTLVGFHALHVSLGVVAMLVLLAVVRDGPSQRAGVEMTSWYWHFVDVVWLVVFTVVYLLGR